NLRAESLSWRPASSWWLVVGSVIATGLLTGNWFIAAGVLTFILIQVFRPFDFISTYLLVVGGSTFIYYEGGRLTLQMSLLTAAFALMGVNFVLVQLERGLALPWNNLSWAILAFVTWSLAAFVRGVLVGNSMKFGLIELYAVLA